MDTQLFKQQMLKRFGLAGAIVLVVIFFLGLSWKELRWTGQTMGTSFSVHAFLPGFLIADDDVSFDDLKAVVLEELAVVNDSMSTYKADSEISQFNQGLPDLHKCVELSPPFLDTLRIAEKVHVQTNGFYDVTLGPLIDLWGFGGNSQLKLDWQPPSADLIDEALEKVGFDRMKIQEQCVVKQAELELDLSSVAKGYAVDRIKDAFRAKGVEHFLIEIGGEVFASGYKKPLRPWLSAGVWRVAIEQPGKEPGTPSLPPVEILDFAVATSGDYRNYFEFQGVHYSHLIDPQTGQALQYDQLPGQKLRSVTVIGPSAGVADALATGLLVVGLERAKAIATLNKVATLLLFESTQQDGDRVQRKSGVWRSPAFIDKFGEERGAR